LEENCGNSVNLINNIKQDKEKVKLKYFNFEILPYMEAETLLALYYP
jgi:hypothetical protein